MCVIWAQTYNYLIILSESNITNLSVETNLPDLSSMPSSLLFYLTMHASGPLSPRIASLLMNSQIAGK